MYFYNMHEGGIAPSRPPLKKLIIQLMSHFWTPMTYIYGGELAPMGAHPTGGRQGPSAPRGHRRWTRQWSQCPLDTIINYCSKAFNLASFSLRF